MPHVSHLMMVKGFVLLVCGAMFASRARADVNQDLAQLAIQKQAQEPVLAERAQPRPVVFAHYMTCYFNTVEFYMREIELAQRHGIDGFALNCGAWSTQPAYIAAAERMYEAAKRLNSGFVLVMSPDGCRSEMPDMLKRFYNHPNQFRWKGKVVMSGYGGGEPRQWAEVVNATRKEGFDFLFVPATHLPPRHKMAFSYETAMGTFLGNDHMDGHFRFAIDGSVNDLMRDNALLRRVTQHLGKIYMAGVAPAYNSPNLRDFQGYRGYDAMWRSVLRDRPDWVEIVTWSDYNEDSNLMPYRWSNPAGSEKQYFDRDESFLDLTGYFAAAFHARQMPPITQDKVYYAYRNRSRDLRREWNPETQAWEDLTLRPHRNVGGTPTTFDQIHEDVQDRVYVTTLLTQPAQLVVTLADQRHVFDQPAGVSHVAVPLAAGVPHFLLQRGGQMLTEFSGRKQILDQSTQTKANSWMSYHLANRTWTGGAVVGPAAVRLRSAEGQLLNGAQIVTINNERGVQNQLNDGSGFRVPVGDLHTGTYAIRVSYCNPTDTEARLTLSADGSPQVAEGSYYIPLILPPTESGKVATVSFLWSLYDNTKQLTVAWRDNGQAAPPATMKYPSPLMADQGTPIITNIELIKVEPTREPKQEPVLFSELVEIPAGTFTMGSDKSRPDEAPAHAVTLPRFAIGKYPVTNEEYLKYDPSHAQFRDGYSWRDREPKIYVSWLDAVQYCNWLSKQAGLTPAYEIQKSQVTFHAGAEGFRLPSEAEWEYVASGRGQGRRYPWGEETPVAGLHGNFAGNNHFWPGPDPLQFNPNLPSDLGGGTMVVGSYPAGASRDGVMDLSGNVCQWVNDWYGPYAPEMATNPQGQDSHRSYRSLRGSSWGYYGKSLRVTAREYNSPGYGGYIYIGFRVALPEAGLNKLKH